MSDRLSRKQLLRLAGVAGGGLALGAAGCASNRSGASQPGSSARTARSHTEPFHGTHQAGITTPQQKYLQFGAFDLNARSRGDLRDLLHVWTDAGARLTSGQPEQGDQPFDPARLTLTVGFGASLFDTRFGLGPRRPPALADIPHFHGDRLDAARSHGDIGVQCCSESSEVAARALHTLATTARSVARLRWSHAGFIRDPLPGEEGGTPRNLFGFKDGTNNLDTTDDARMRENVWVNPGDGPAWMTNGTYLVCRRIVMQIQEFLPEPVDVQQHAIGRKKASGAPYGQKHEFDPVIPSKEPVDSHIMVGNPRRAGSQAERILRRGYTFTDGYDAELSTPRGGLFFIALQCDPRRQFISIQRRLATQDRLAHYIVHEGSAAFAIPPGTQPGGYLGETLLGA
ncbi:MAG: Dyp-type peroxidase [Gaiellales bacterium]